MKNLRSQLILRKSKSTTDQDFSTCTHPSRNKAMIAIQREHQSPFYWQPEFHNNLTEASFNIDPSSSKTSLSESSSLEFQLIPTPKTPKESIQKSLLKLRNSQWNDSAEALRNIVQISRVEPQLLEKHKPEICKGTTTLLKTLRLRAARTACQAANVLFMNIKTFKGSEFEELIHTLLQKSGDTNKTLRKDVLEALDSMVIHIPPVQSVKVLLHRRIASYNLSARITAAKLLACVLITSGAKLNTTLNDDWKTCLVQAAIRFLQDDCKDINFHGMHLVTLLMQQKGFEKIFRTKINLSTLNKILESVKNSFG